MFTPIVPFVPNTTVINKTIVYSDTVLSLKDLGGNIKVTCIEGVSEASLKTCLEKVFESNPNVIFNTIQYSKNDKKVYFYTNQKITTSAYEKSKFTTYQPITSTSEILKEVKNVLLAPENKDNDVISLYDVAQLLKKRNDEYNSMIKKYKQSLEGLLHSNFNCNSRIIIGNFNNENKMLEIRFKRWEYSDYKKIWLSKENNDLYIAKTESIYAKELFRVLSSELSNLYDELAKYADYKDITNAIYDINAVNSNFIVKISDYGTGIYVVSRTNRFNNDFELFAPSYKDDYSLECNSNIVNETLKDKEEEILKKIFVCIRNCPKWCQEALYEIRQNQLEEERNKEIKRQKRANLTRKLFPFLKN